MFNSLNSEHKSSSSSTQVKEMLPPSSVRWSCSTQERANSHANSPDPHRAIARSAAHCTGAITCITKWTEVCQWPTHCTTVYTSFVTAVQHKTRSRRPEPQCTAATHLFNTADGAQGYTSTTHISTTASIPYLQGAPSVRLSVLTRAGVHVSGRTSISQFKTAHAGAPHPAGPHHSTHLAPQHAPHALPDSARHDGSRTRQQAPRRDAAALPVLCPLAGNGRSARRAAAAAATCRHSSEQVFLPEELRGREVGRVGKHVAHLGGGYVEPLRNAMPDSFP